MTAFVPGHSGGSAPVFHGASLLGHHAAGSWWGPATGAKRIANGGHIAEGIFQFQNGFPGPAVSREANRSLRKQKPEPAKSICFGLIREDLASGSLPGPRGSVAIERQAGLLA